MNLVEMLKPTEGEECQWLGVYVTKWQREWGEPSVMFRDVDTAAIASVPEVKALVDAASGLLEAARAEYEDAACVAQWVTDEPTVAVLDAALAPFKATVVAERGE